MPVRVRYRPKSRLGTSSAERKYGAMAFLEIGTDRA